MTAPKPIVVDGVTPLCSTGCRAPATSVWKFPGGALYYCEAHKRPEAKP